MDREEALYIIACYKACNKMIGCTKSNCPARGTENCTDIIEPARVEYARKILTMYKG
jgi:hypothetical protein